MVIVCSNCQTRFNLADERIPASGAKVRCSRCQHSFHVSPPPPAATPASFLGEPERRREPLAPESVTDTASEPVFGAAEEPGVDLRGNKLPYAEDLEPEVDVDPLGSWDPFEGVEEEPVPAPPPRRNRPTDRASLFEAPMASASAEESIDSAPHPIPEVSDPAPTVVEERTPASQDGSDADALEPQSLVTWIPQAFAVIVGMSLMVGGIRALSFAIAPAPGPQTLAAAGWVASEMSLRRTGEQGGVGGLELRGRLEGRPGSPRPRLELTLLDSRGTAVGQPSRAALIGEDPEPAAGFAAERVTGFRIMIPEPPPSALRYRLDLDAG